MESIASELKAQRENQNITLSQMAADTHISMRHLQSLEEGRFEDLPGGMYNRAFLRAYCEVLGLDQAEILRRYESEIIPHASKPDKSKSSISSSIRIPPLAIWSLMLVISVISIFLNRKWIFPLVSPYFTKSSSIQDQVAVPPAPAPAPATASSVQDTPPASAALEEKESPVLSQSQGSIPAPEQQSVNPTATAPSALPASANVFQLEVLAKEKCWISIQSDGVSVLSRNMEPDEKQSFKANRNFFIKAGNAGGVKLKINGKSLKKLGNSGEVIKLLVDEQSLPELLDRTAG